MAVNVVIWLHQDDRWYQNRGDDNGAGLIFWNLVIDSLLLHTTREERNVSGLLMKL